MQDQEFEQEEFGELELDSFEMEAGEDFAGEIEGLDETQEMELAAELMAVSSEEELDQFLGKFFKGVWKGVKKVAGPLGGLLKGIAKKALPFLGGALGSFIPIPGVGTAIGSALGGAASKLLEVDLEGIGPEEQEFELARRFVRLANEAVAQAAQTTQASPAANPTAIAAVAVRNAADALGSRPATPRQRRPKSGRWVRQGNRILVLGV